MDADQSRGTERSSHIRGTEWLASITAEHLISNFLRAPRHLGAFSRDFECPTVLREAGESRSCFAFFAMVALVQKLAIVLAIGTLALFFFPMASGSFQATHGPVTALRAARFVRVVLAAMASLFSLLIGFSESQLRAREDETTGVLCGAPVVGPPLRC